MNARARRAAPPKPIPQPLWERRFKIVRDVILFSLGVAIIVNEVWFLKGTERESILILATGLVGMPFILWAEEARRKNGR